MKLTVLGCSGAYPSKDSGTTSYLLQSNNFNLLIDVGSNTFNQLRSNIDPFDIDAVIITHYHYDHIADLGVLQYYLQLNKDDNYSILPIYGHTEDQEHFNELTLNNVTQGFSYNENKFLDLGPFYIEFLKTVHPVTTFALRILEKDTGKVLVFTADTGYFEEIIDFARDADLFLTDTYFLKNIQNHHAHLSTVETGNIAKLANAKCIVLSHLNEKIPKDDLIKETQIAYESDNVKIAYSGLKIDI